MRSVTVALLLLAAPAAAAPVPKGRESLNPFGHGFLGVTMAQNGSMTVGVVSADSPAAQAGLRAGDVILAVGPVRPRVFDEVRAFVGASRPGTTVAVVVRRADAEVTLPVVLGEAPPDVVDTYRAMRLNGVLPPELR